MHIQLKQVEIEAALKMYISSRGISLDNQHVEVSFTSKRVGGAGVTADLEINPAAQTETPSPAPVAVVAPAAQEVAAPVAEADATEAAEIFDAVEETELPAKASLFG